MSKLYLLFLLALLSPTLSSSQTSPCGQYDIFNKLDFWVGEWKVYNPQGQEAGYNKITKILDGCSLLEEWTGTGGSTGKSLNFYNPQKKVWQQVWIDNFSNPLYFDGEVQDDAMIYRGTSMDRQGAEVLNEMTLSKVSDNEVRQLWRQSTDGGENWTVAFDGKYVRIE